MQACSMLNRLESTGKGLKEKNIHDRLWGEGGWAQNTR